jgi:hypothetical protein
MPLLYWNLRDLSEYIPENVLNDLKQSFNRNAKKNLMFLGELIIVLKSVNYEGISAIPYKGPVLAISAYNNLVLRDFSDIDIFIRGEDIPKVKEILISRGYKTYFNFEKVDENFYVRSQRECKFFNDKKGITIELHWKFSRLSFPIKMEDLIEFDNLKNINLGGLNVLELSPEDLILILSVHNATHYWKRLSWLCDIAELIQRNNVIEWSKILEKADKLNIKRIILINLFLIKDLYVLKFPQELFDEMNSDKTAQQISMLLKKNFLKKDHNYTIIEEGFLSFKIRENWICGLKDFFGSAIIPDQSELKNINFNPFLFRLYYIIRPFQLLMKYGIFKPK